MGAIYNNNIILDGLKIYYDFKNSRCYGGSGTTVNDLGLDKNNGTNANASFNSAGYFTFNATGSISADEVFESSSITAEAWIYPTSSPTSSDANRIWSRDRSDYWMLGHYGTDDYIEWYVVVNNSGAQYFSAANSITLNTWQHVAGTYDGSTGLQAIYLNGDLLQSRTIATTSSNLGNGSTRPIVMGDNVESGGAQAGPGFVGNIGQGRVYNVALSASQIKTNFEAHRLRYGI